jgi:ubiquinone/menaquinone biosynthesis C-methylase UbiE
LEPEEVYFNAARINDERMRDALAHPWELSEWYVHPERSSWILDTVGRLKPENILDVGCGPGLLALGPLSREYKIIGLDVSLEAVRVCKGIGLPAIWGDAHNLPFKGSSFDLIIATEILDHVAYPDRVMDEIKRVAREFVIFSVDSNCEIPDGKIHLRTFNGATFISFLKGYMKVREVSYIEWLTPHSNQNYLGWWMALCEIGEQDAPYRVD